MLRILSWAFFLGSLLMSLASVLWWHLVSPVSLAPSAWVLSTDRYVFGEDPDKARAGALNEFWNWGNTFSFSPREIVFPRSVHELQAAVHTAVRVRVVSGGHSFSPSLATSDTSIDMRFLNAVGPIHTVSSTDDDTGQMDVVVAEAGATIRYMQHVLVNQGYNLHGFGGGTHANTLGGGISTNLHGSQSLLLAQHVVSLAVVLPNGEVRTLSANDTLFSAVKSGLGRLGVIYQVTIRVHKRRCLRVRAVESTLLEALEALASPDAIGEFQASEWGLRNNQGVLKTYHDVKPTCPVDFPLHVDRSLGSAASPYVHDHWITALQVLFPQGPRWKWVYTRYVASLLADHDHVVGLEMGWRYRVAPMYGQLFTEYSVPRHRCLATVQQILTVAAQEDFVLTSMNIRSLTVPENNTLLAYAPVASCTIEVYAGGFESNFARVFTRIQEVVRTQGGRSHFGTVFFGTQHNVTSRLGAAAVSNEAAFWTLVAEHDPSGKFRTTQEEWASKYYVDFERQSNRAVMFRVWVLSAFVFGLLWLVALCTCGCRDRYTCTCCSGCPGYRNPHSSGSRYEKIK
jgi:UDP-N-acetylenolpyruvoylglucosamine reductase